MHTVGEGGGGGGNHRCMVMYVDGASPVWYFAIVYFNWLVFTGAYVALARRRRCQAGGVAILIGAMMQVAAYGLHWREWQRLAGEPDQLYVWIPPLVIAGLSLPVLAGGLLVSALAGRGGD